MERTWELLFRVYGFRGYRAFIGLYRGVESQMGKTIKHEMEAGMTCLWRPQKRNLDLSICRVSNHSIKPFHLPILGLDEARVGKRSLQDYENASLIQFALSHRPRDQVALFWKIRLQDGCQICSIPRTASASTREACP